MNGTPVLLRGHLTQIRSRLEIIQAVLRKSLIIKVPQLFQAGLQLRQHSTRLNLYRGNISQGQVDGAHYKHKSSHKKCQKKLSKLRNLSKFKISTYKKSQDPKKKLQKPKKLRATFFDTAL